MTATTTPIYLDNAASTAVDPVVVERMVEVMRTCYGNPSAAHPLGRAARATLEAARAELAAALGDPVGGRDQRGQVVFTSGCTEADALAVLGAARARGTGAVVHSAVEHAAVAASAGLLDEARHPRVVLPVGADGRLDLAALAAVPADAAVVALVLVQNEIGVIQPVAEVAAAVRARAPGAHVHVDAAQALGKIALDVGALGVDSLALAGHKLHGPKGAGALWLAHGARVTPLWRGGGQEGGLRAGTEDVPAAAGLALAATRAVAARAEASERWAAMRRTVLAALAAAGLEHLEVGAGAARAPHILSVALRRVSAAGLRNVLISRGVYVSTGSACAERDSKPSAVLAALGLGPDWGVARLSLGLTTTQAEVTRASGLLAEAARDLVGVAATDPAHDASAPRHGMVPDA
ncbi:MAG: aminotransferase class V-fold PLP-dependent enzyme [Kofleriaceae bacterium]|nr:aminotransferase class V-fold PLP-dependent enzyme [Kofleriaceae bacterium]MBP6838646.1 aminotransferase class V-fold PLP-dependent enzyme [Kofleriaceae bacterium]MBP9207744.1 aminotransferase class V-fold PLP-dependent enzyme [Kofleriaceae bacterium]